MLKRVPDKKGVAATDRIPVVIVLIIYNRAARENCANEKSIVLMLQLFFSVNFFSSTEIHYNFHCILPVVSHENHSKIVILFLLKHMFQTWLLVRTRMCSGGFVNNIFLVFLHF